MSVSKRYVFLSVAVLVAVAAWSAWWFYVAGQVKTRTGTWIEQLATQGTVVSYSRFDVSGYPFRIEAALTDVTVGLNRAPQRPALIIPRVQVFGQPWNPSRIDARVFGPVTITTVSPDGMSHKGRLAAQEILARMHLTAGKPDRLAVSLNHPSLTLEALPLPVSAKMLAIHARHLLVADNTASTGGQGGPKAPLTVELAVDGTGITLPWPTGPFGTAIDTFQLTLGLNGGIHDQGPPRVVLGAWRDQGGTLELSRFRLKWGKLDADLTGTFGLDRKFRPEGAVSGRLSGLDQMIDLAVSGGRMTAAQAAQAKRGIGALSFLTRDGLGRVPVSLSIQNGRLRFGPIPIGKVGPLF